MFFIQDNLDSQMPLLKIHYITYMGLKLMHKMTSKKRNKMLQHIMKLFCNPMEKMLKNKQKDEITFLNPCVINEKEIMVKTILIMKD